MADPTGTAPYLLVFPDSDLENSRTFAVDGGSGLDTADFGPEGNYVITTIDALAKINFLGSQGFVVGVTGSPYFYTRQFVSGDGSITIDNPAGLAGDVDLSVAAEGSIQLINFEYNDVGLGTGSTLNLVPGSGIDITANYDAGSKTASYTLSTESGGTVTSVALASDTGLIIDGSPITTEGTIDVNLPEGELHQFLRIASVGPQVLEFITIESGAGLATFLCQTGDDLPTNGINLGAEGALLGIGTETPAVPLDIYSTTTVLSPFTAAVGLNVITNPGDKRGYALFTNYGGSNGDSNIGLLSANGTFAAPTRVTSGDIIGGIRCHPYVSDSGTAGTGDFTTNPSAQILFGATETQTTTAQGTAAYIYTTATGSNSASASMTIAGGGTPRVGIGDTSPTYSLDIVNSVARTTYDYNTIRLSSQAAASGHDFGGIEARTYTGNSTLNLYRAEGTIAAPLPIAGAETLSTINFGGYDGTVFQTTGYISAQSTQAFTGSHQGTSLKFFNVAQDSAYDAIQERMIIDQSGFVGINNAASTYAQTPKYQLEVYSTDTTPTFGAIAQFVSNSTSPFYKGILVDAYTQAGQIRGGAEIFLRTALGTYAVPVVVTSGYDIGTISGAGCYQAVSGGDNAFLARSGKISFTATQTFSGTALGTAINFWSTPNNAVIPVLAMTIDQTGYVGIGVSTPAYPLDVYSTLVSGTGAGMQVVVNTGTNTTGTSYFTNYGGTSPSSNIALKSARNTLAAPRRVQSADFFGSFGSTPYYAADDSSTGSFATGPTAYMAFAALESQTSAAQGNRIDLYTTATGTNAPTPTMSILGGNTTSSVGIGMTAPLFPLDILSFSSRGVNVVTNAINGCSVVTRNYHSTPNPGFQSFSSKGSSATAASPTVSGNTLMKLSAFGNYSATATPTYSAAGNAVIQAAAIEDFTGSSNVGTAWYILTTPAGSGTLGTSVIIQGGGSSVAQVGIGMTPTAQLQLNIDSTLKPSTNLWGVTSDARIKTDIVDIEEALPIINQVKPRRYKYTKEHAQYSKDQSKIFDSEGNCIDEGCSSVCTETEYYGFVADELETVLPSCVTVSTGCSGEHKDLKTVNPHNLYILMVKAIQELSAKVAALEAKLAA